ncbi:helix-turn-helix transcriptional regulator [Nocardiopsis sp. EMB25]|uniref:helix-turn-helix domain-containing protein n=1 Tax=Nocardiopsis TaxID=2013 RepID=UPI0003484ECC|nr:MULTISPECIES: helix-turn-helix transcriptional regulator [Nocardiopsis]MCY9782938.1 helix-turn-helix transcriptional regulator [Nocardiopsis sp. EMB25]
MAHSVWRISGDWSGHPGYERAGWCVALSTVVHQERTARGWSHAELAERMGIGIDEAEELEENATYPGPELLVRLAHVFGAEGAVTRTDADGVELIEFTPRVA